MYLSHIAENIKKRKQRPKNTDLLLNGRAGVKRVRKTELMAYLRRMVKGLWRFTNMKK